MRFVSVALRSAQWCNTARMCSCESVCRWALLSEMRLCYVLFFRFSFFLTEPLIFFNVRLCIMFFHSTEAFLSSHPYLAYAGHLFHPMQNFRPVFHQNIVLALFLLPKFTRLMQCAAVGRSFFPHFNRFIFPALVCGCVCVCVGRFPYCNSLSTSAPRICVSRNSIFSCVTFIQVFFFFFF